MSPSSLTDSVVPREVTQAKLDRRNAAAARHRASQTEGIAERLEARQPAAPPPPPRP